MFATADAVNQPFSEGEGSQPRGQTQQPGPEYAAHQERLANLPECGDADGVAPCRIGDIIIEEATSGDVDVWRRDN